MNKLTRSALISVCISALAAPAAFAHPSHGAQGAAHPAREHAERAFARPTQRVEARLAYVKTALNITNAQQTQWDAYAGVVRKFAQDKEMRIKAKRSAWKSAPAQRQRPNAIERLEKAQSFHAERIAMINQLLEVEKPLYAALSPEQQKVADEVLGQRHRAKQGRRGHRGFGRG